MSQRGQGLYVKNNVNDLLKFKKEDVKNIKIKFNQPNGYEDLMELYQSNPYIVNNEWLFWKGNNKIS